MDALRKWSSVNVKMNELDRTNGYVKNGNIVLEHRMLQLRSYFRTYCMASYGIYLLLVGDDSDYIEEDELDEDSDEMPYLDILREEFGYDCGYCEEHDIMDELYNGPMDKQLKHQSECLACVELAILEVEGVHQCIEANTTLDQLIYSIDVNKIISSYLSTPVNKKSILLFYVCLCVCVCFSFFFGMSSYSSSWSTFIGKDDVQLLCDWSKLCKRTSSLSYTSYHIRNKLDSTKHEVESYDSRLLELNDRFRMCSSLSYALFLLIGTHGIADEHKRCIDCIGEELISCVFVVVADARAKYALGLQEVRSQLVESFQEVKIAILELEGVEPAFTMRRILNETEMREIIKVKGVADIMSGYISTPVKSIKFTKL